MKSFFKRKKTAEKNKGTVRIIVLFLLASVGLRLVTHVDVALANIDTDVEKVEPMVKETSAAPLAATDEDLNAVLKAFSEREEKIRQQEEMIEKRMKALSIADQKINERIQELKRTEEELRSTLALANSAAEDDLARLTAVYENMKPKTAAALFQEMDPDFAAGFLARMRPDSAAAVMAGMTPESAYSISAILAGRNANVPKE